jgi:hypothetical protein
MERWRERGGRERGEEEERRDGKRKIDSLVGSVPPQRDQASFHRINGKKTRFVRRGWQGLNPCP